MVKTPCPVVDDVKAQGEMEGAAWDKRVPPSSMFLYTSHVLAVASPSPMVAQELPHGVQG